MGQLALVPRSKMSPPIELTADRAPWPRRPVSWLDIPGPVTSRAEALAAGTLAAALAVVLGFLLKSHTGGGEPLMAVFPILLVSSLRWGDLAGAVTLIGGVVGAWYVYLGDQFSFVISPEEVRSLITAFSAGVLILAVCALLRSRSIQLVSANQSLSHAIAESARVQEALALSEAQFRTSFERAAVGKAQSDPLTGRILRVNQAFADMLGYQPEDLVGRLGWELTLDEDLEVEQAAFARVVEGRSDAYIREKRYLRRDGEVIWGRVSATVIRAPESGEPVLAVAVVENVDARHKADAELRAAKQDLEGLLEQRTEALAQRDLLLREVYHRVKNNLQIVDSLLVLTRRGLTDPEATAALGALRDRVYALGLVHHQLMGSTDLKTFDIGPFLTELSANLLTATGSQGIGLTVRAAPLRVGLDFAIPLGLVVTELITNALKHAFPSGAGTIEVALAEAADGAVTLTVSDDGGAEPAIPATRAGETLGMTIVEALVRQLGGVLSIRRAGGRVSEVQIARPVLH